jgi:hypothetical protein
MEGDMRRILCVFAVLSVMPAMSVAWGQAEFPQSLEGIVPRYPGAILELSTMSGDGTTVHMEVDAEPKAITDFYRKALSERGWKVDMDMTDAKGCVLVLNKGTEKINVTVIGEPGERTRFVITFMSK